MAEKIFDIVADPNVMEKIVALAKRQGLESSEPMATESVSDALDSPLGVDEIRQIAEVITIIASTGTTVVGFLAALKELLGNTESAEGKEAEAVVIDTRTRREIGIINQDTDLEKLEL